MHINHPKVPDRPRDLSEAAGQVDDRKKCVITFDMSEIY